MTLFVVWRPEWLESCLYIYIKIKKRSSSLHTVKFTLLTQMRDQSCMFLKGNSSISTGTIAVASVQLPMTIYHCLFAVRVLINYLHRCNLDEGVLIEHCAWMCVHGWIRGQCNALWGKVLESAIYVHSAYHWPFYVYVYMLDQKAKNINVWGFFLFKKVPVLC